MDLHELLTVRLESLAERSLEPVRVAIVDSGIDATHPELAPRVCRAEAIVHDGGRYVSTLLDHTADNDVCGHGTAVAGMVAQVAPNARLHDIRVLDENNRAKGAALIEGFRAAVASDARVINLSLACSKHFAPELSELCEDAYENGQVVVASRRNMPLRDDGYPAELAATVSVDIGAVTSIYDVLYRQQKRIEFAGAGDDVRSFARGGGYRFVTGTSFATPQVAGLVCLLLGVNPTLTSFELKTLLKAARRH